MTADTHYDVLGVGHDVDAPALRKAYVAKAREFHPDFHASESAEIQAFAELQMRLINTAWEVLGSPSTRTAYDKKLRNSGRLAPPSSAAASRPPTATSRPQPNAGSGTAPPRWLTMLPVLCLMTAVASFSVGVVTRLSAVLAAAVILAAIGAVMFAIVPMVALKRSKQGRRSPGGPTVNA